jgi:hypothetical protein
MKKNAIICVLLLAPVLFVYSQQGVKQNKRLTIADARAALNEGFAKFPYAIQEIADKSPSSASNSVVVRKFMYQAAEDEYGNPLNGEILHVIIIYNGYQYTMKYDFQPVIPAGLSPTIVKPTAEWKRLTFNLMADLPQK